MKRQRIYYVPGMISLLIIPMVFWYLGCQKLNEPIPNVMDVSVPTKYNLNVPLKSQPFAFESARNLKYKKIIVLPNTAKSNSKYYVSELKNLQKRNEKNTGIEFILNTKNSYGDFASILNDFHIANQEQYALDLDKTGNLFAITDYIDYKALKEPCYLCDDTIDTFYEPTIFEKFTTHFSELSKLPQQAFYIIFGYLILLNFSVLSLVRKSI